MTTKQSNKKQRVVLDLRGSTNKAIERLINYFISDSHVQSHRELMLNAIEPFYLLFSTPKEDPDFERIRMESIVALEARLKLLQTYDGETYNRTPSQHGHYGAIQQHPTHSYHVPPMAQPGTQFMAMPGAVANPSTPQPTVVETSEIPSDPALFTIETLEIELQRLTQEFERAIENGELGIQITKTLQNLEPEDPELWTDEMYEIYDRVRLQFKKTVNDKRFKQPK